MFIAGLTVFQTIPVLVTLFALGACAGSFMRVVQVRQSWRRSVTGRSRCSGCGKTLPWHHLVPTVSYFALRGKCPSCSAAIPPADVAAETATGALFVLAVLAGESPYDAVAVMLSALFLVPIIIEDIASMEVPEHLSLPFAYAAFAVAVFVSLHSGSAAPLVSGLVLAVPFALLWLCSRGRAMGLGDAKVAVAFGLLLADPVRALSALLFSFWIGALGVLLIALVRRVRGASVRTMRGMRVPFVPCIAAAYFLVLLTDVSVSSVAGMLA